LRIKVLRMDVDNDAAVSKAVAGILAETGRIDVLVNNAGIAVTGPVEELPLAEFRRVMETNYFGALRCIQAVVPGMRERHAAGSKVFLQVGSVEAARRAAAAGVDVIIAQGTEAGGHVEGEVATMALAPRIVDAVAPIPVAVAGVSRTRVE
jgi:NAD(P)H-dependent flavin oxidoreductase YrpB (nitropropane dioxygenase family)